MKKAIAIIPARYASTRLPGKPLRLIGGKPMILCVVEQALKAVERVVVATDHEKILHTVISAGYEAVMTNPDHPSGTDRIAEAFALSDQGEDVVLNVQGDEPFIQPQVIQDLLATFEDGEVAIATSMIPFPPSTTFAQLQNPNSPKVVVDEAMNVLYFSRSVIPYLRDIAPDDWAKSHTFYKHIGLYAFRRDVLPELTRLKKTSLEKGESLEQLRWLGNGFRIKACVTHYPSIGIDTEDDLVAANRFVESSHV